MTILSDYLRSHSKDAVFEKKSERQPMTAFLYQKYGKFALLYIAFVWFSLIFTQKMILAFWHS